MKNKWIGIILIVCLAAGAAYIVQSRSEGNHSSAKAPETFYCPMHPNYTSDRPGDCPICHMKLVPLQKKGDSDSACLMHECPMLKAGEDCPMLLLPKGQGGADCPYCSKHLHGNEKVSVTAPASSVEMTESAGLKIGVRTEPVGRRALKKEILLQARVAYDPELYQAQLDYLQKTKRYNRPSYVIDPYSSESADRARLELSMFGLSKEMIDEIKTWKRPDARLIGADESGQLWIYAYFYEEDAAFAKPGTVLEVGVPGGRTIQAKILYVDSVVQSQSRTLRARALVDDTEKSLRPDMYVQAKLIADLGEKLAVPEEALLHAGDEPYVFVRREGRLYEPRTVRIGQKAGRYHEVLEGLKEGEVVIVSGNFLVDSESRIQSAISGAPAAAQGEHRHD